MKTRHMGNGAFCLCSTMISPSLASKKFDFLLASVMFFSESAWVATVSVSCTAFMLDVPRITKLTSVCVLKHRVSTVFSVFRFSHSCPLLKPPGLQLVRKESDLLLCFPFFNVRNWVCECWMVWRQTHFEKHSFVNPSSVSLASFVVPSEFLNLVLNVLAMSTWH